ncbi:hypothetical protein BG000_001966, partial [Podila horticola]
DQHDWVRLVEKIDPSVLDDFSLGDGSHQQFMSTPDAVGFYLKRVQQGEDSDEDD